MESDAALLGGIFVCIIIERLHLRRIIADPLGDLLDQVNITDPVVGQRIDLLRGGVARFPRRSPDCPRLICLGGWAVWSPVAADAEYPAVIFLYDGAADQVHEFEPDSPMLLYSKGSLR